MTEIRRCDWAYASDELMLNYHDQQWGKPCFDDQELFEMLILEGAQAGLSWSTILKKRARYHEVFDGFDPQIVANYGDEKVASLLQDPGIVRNRLKIAATITNAKCVLELGSLSDYVWAFVDHTPIVGDWLSFEEMPLTTPLAEQISKDLKKKGFTFVGPTIIYSWLQAIGVVNDHMAWCERQPS